MGHPEVVVRFARLRGRSSGLVCAGNRWHLQGPVVAPWSLPSRNRLECLAAFELRQCAERSGTKSLSELLEVLRCPRLSEDIFCIGLDYMYNPAKVGMFCICGDMLYIMQDMQYLDIGVIRRRTLEDLNKPRTGIQGLSGG